MKVLFDDSEIIVLDKPVGLATANSPRGENSLYVELVNRFGSGCFVGVVSRLDKPVSGVVVFGKNKSATASLAEQFRHRTVKKEYIAIVERRFPSALGEWVTWRDRIHWDDMARRAVVDGPRRQSSLSERVTTKGVGRRFCRNFCTGSKTGWRSLASRTAADNWPATSIACSVGISGMSYCR